MMEQDTVAPLAAWLSSISLQERASVLCITDAAQLALFHVVVSRSVVGEGGNAGPSGADEQIRVALFEWTWLEQQLEAKRRGGSSRREVPRGGGVDEALDALPRHTMDAVVAAGLELVRGNRK